MSYLPSLVQNGEASKVRALLESYAQTPNAPFSEEDKREAAVAIVNYISKSFIPQNASETRGYEGSDGKVAYVPPVSQEEAKEMYRASKDFLISFLDTYKFSTPAGDFRDQALFKVFTNIADFTVNTMNEWREPEDTRYETALKNLVATGEHFQIPLAERLNFFTLSPDQAYDSDGSEVMDFSSSDDDTSGGEDNGEDNGEETEDEDMLNGDDLSEDEAVMYFYPGQVLAQFVDRCLVIK